MIILIYYISLRNGNFKELMIMITWYCNGTEINMHDEQSFDKKLG